MNETLRTRFVILFLACLLAYSIAGCATGPRETGKATVIAGAHTPGARPPIEVTRVRLTGEGRFIDLRYRIVHADDAAAVTSRKVKPFIIDQATGKTLAVTMTKLGALRSSSVKPQANRQYTILFGNNDRTIKKGSAVTIVMGTFRAEDIIVQ